ncbi:hypothetical protein SLEP1_g51925 [Rubroshorea leprosula]|uniref:NB-ARC domain-containing protein n=1 Tax=Rubroshorea leprosula TaxID=152421 RepID=A0AAV5M701_9ROSI|nr:hypothetical protein SLEP1_g51925 [Rubroshorea leprosula]
MADIAGVIVSALSCICSTPTCNCIDQYRSFNDDVSELRRKLHSLTSRKQDIESGIQVVEARGVQMVRQEVQDWLKHAQDINVDVQAVLEKVQRVRWYKRAYLGKLVCRKINVVKGMLEKGSFPEGSFPEGLVIGGAPAREVIIPTENLVGEISTKEEIWGYLTGDEFGMIGVCGIGGVGKTTIMENVYNDLRKQTKFQKFLWVTVSHPLNVFELQKKIAGGMEETLSEDKEEKMRAAELMDIMGRRKFVLILDDVWDKFSLKDVGIPDPKAQNGCKVVVTSRSIEVCSYLQCKIVKVKPLSKEKSLKLFLDTVGDDISQVTGLEDILKLIVEECAGLPLAIVVIAASMRGVDDVNVWRNALTELRERVKGVNDWDDQIFQRLRFSFDRLDRLDIKKCFLYCSLFREDYEFFRTELIEGWIDDGLIDIDELGSRQKAYDRGHALLDKLMHDVVRDMAIKIIGPEFGYMVKELRGVANERGWAEDFRKLSLMAIHISELPAGLSLKCPSLSTLILSDNHISEIPKSFFEDMGTLKVLDLSRTDIETLPDSICDLENLSVLRLRGCQRLKCLPFLGKLRALKKLDLRGAGIEVVPQGMEILESLEYLNLFCRDLKDIPTGILPKLSSLQYLAVCYLGETSIKIDLEEVARLKKLEILECRLDGLHELNSFVSEFKNFQSLTAYGLVVGYGLRNEMQRITDEIFSYEWSEYRSCLQIKRWLEIKQLKIGGESMVLPDNLEDLWIEYMQNMTSRSLNKIVLLENATELRRCGMRRCEGIECVVELDSSSASSLCCPVLDKLEWLHIYHFPKLCVLVKVEGVATPPCIFSNLKVLYIDDCRKMRELLPLELLQALQNLEEIRVWNCAEMEEIIASSDSDASSDKFTFTFPKLRMLELVGLQKLKSICSAKGVKIYDSIEEIDICDCPELKRNPFQLPLLDNGQPSPPPHLTAIKIHTESEGWWESVEWDHPNAKNLLQPYLKYYD